jgi:hypothetical protein
MASVMITYHGYGVSIKTTSQLAVPILAAMTILSVLGTGWAMIAQFRDPEFRARVRKRAEQDRKNYY